MAAGQTAPLKVGILSIGDMGVGIARLLIAKGFPVASNVTGRSQDTITRAKDAGVELLQTDEELVATVDLLLSVVPPADASATAQRVLDALFGPGAAPGRAEGRPPLYLADMNAVSPATCRSIASAVERSGLPIRFIDGCILGGPPAPKPKPEAGAAEVGDGSSSQQPPPPPPTEEEEGGGGGEWTVPLLPTSGPHSIASIPHPSAARLSAVLNARHVSPDVGAASGLKMCFASLSKGLAAVAVQSFTTAQALGVLPDLRRALAELSPARARQAEAAVVGAPPKAYRWVREMEEIAATHAADGGFEAPGLFGGCAGVFRALAEDPVLGREKVGARKRGLTVEDVAMVMSEGLARKRKKNE